MTEALVTLTDSAHDGFFNIGSGVPTPIGDVARIVLREFRPDLLERFELRLPRDMDAAANDVLFANTQRLTSETDFRLSVPLVDGIREMGPGR